MRITEVETYHLRLPQVAAECNGTQDALLVRVHTDVGLIGIGEVDSSPHVIRAVFDAPYSHTLAAGLRHLLIGEDPRDIERLWEKMYRGTLYFGRRGAAIHAISGVDIALWDLLGKATGLPVYQLLGGAYCRRMPAYASDLMPATPEEAYDRAAALCDAGFRYVKLGWGGLGQSEAQDVALARAARRGIGEENALMIDAGLCWDAATAIARVRRLEDLDLTWVEEPLPPDDLGGYARLADAVDTRIAAGEELATCWEFCDLMDRGRIDVVQVDVSRAGGLTEARRIAHLARQRNLPCVPHAYSTGVLLAASLHWAASLPNGWLVEYTVEESPLATGLTGTGLLREPLRAVEGYLTVPEAPGLGIELDEEMVARFRVA
ncbi:MAG: mandelate racemase/muconate lactonizing enzyme family protein [Chloroherpetonaceae bacterium]|nr:mandelate racemase/muconate lactonizing enzyme family protein [Chthonomonadaceae bacterium]MDW8207912.1 mandelate racemase/muconate lactonizing enzyme family protein [Chloroherpetonaceae bacterium]